MADRSLVLRLLVADEEPPEKAYRAVCNHIIKTPATLSELIKPDNHSTLLYGITAHNDRLTRLMRCLFDGIHHSIQRFELQNVATATTIFIRHVFIDMSAIDGTQLVQLLVIWLPTIIASNVPQVRDLISFVIKSEIIAQRLLVHPLGITAISSWASTTNTGLRDPETLRAWTEVTFSMIKHCPSGHNLTETSHQWDSLKDVLTPLKKLQRNITTELSGNELQQTSPIPVNVTRVNQEERLALITTHAYFQDKFSQLPESVLLTMQTLGVEMPSSSRKLQEIIEFLENEKTLGVLQAALRSLPCGPCRLRLQAEGPEEQIGGTEQNLSSFILPSRFNMDVFGRCVGTWEVLLSSPALSALQGLQYMNDLDSQRIKKSLEDLAFGSGHNAHSAISRHVRPKLQVPLRSTKCELSARKGKGKFIIWQVDLDVPYQSNLLSQIIKVWAIVELEEVSKVVQHVRLLQSTWSANKIHRCLQQPSTASNDKRKIPVVFEDHSIEVQSDSRRQVALDVRAMDQDLHSLVDKCYPLTEDVLRSHGNRAMSLDFPYKLSRSELDIVLHWSSPSLILGRSGTGKTTCLIFKLVGKYINSKSVPGGKPLRQILLTKSKHLSDKIRGYIKSLIKTLLIGLTDGPLTEINEEMQELEITNATILDLKDRHFPFVCTFEDFLQILENTSVAIRPKINRTDQQSHENRSSHNGSSRKDTNASKRCVDFAVFELKYWPRLPQNLKGKLPISSVFAEIMGVMKGSGSKSMSSGPMTLREYLDKSDRVAPTFTLESERIQAYQLFQHYERLKKENEDVDYVDRVIDVLVAMKNDQSLERLLSAAFDEFFIDEVQDQRIVDLELFLSLLKDSRGFHVAGDTAQNISKESTYRFADIKALVYNHFQQTKQKIRASPVVFTLGLNYRSHDGIVKLASFVVDLLWKAFPRSIDKMMPELGQLQGPLPIIFVGCEPEFLSKVRLDSSDLSPDTAGFGAEQVIITRDDDSSEKLIKKIGDIALFLALAESKGMEFGDVILYNFFSTCPDLGGIRHLSFLLSDSPERFDPHSHAALCPELKQLYVACTRARNILYFVETMSETELSSVGALFTNHAPAPLVKVVRRNDSAFDSYWQLIIDNARKTTRADWVRKGHEYLLIDKYDNALRCFERALDGRGIDIVNAKKSFKQGSILLSQNNMTGAISAFEVAASLFLKVNCTADAVNAMCMIGRFEDAAEMWLKEEIYDKAATLFTRAHLYLRAYDCHRILQDHEAAANALWQGKDYDTLVDYLNQNRTSMQEAVIRAYGAKCIFPLKQNKISPTYRKEAVSLLGSFTEKERLFRQFDMYEALEELYLSVGRIKDIFVSRCRDGKLEQALELLLLQKDVEQFADTPKEEIHLLIDYVVIGRLMESALPRKDIHWTILQDLQNLAEHGYGNRIQEWEGALTCLVDGIQISASTLMTIEDQRIKLVVALQILDSATIGDLLTFDTVFSDTLSEAFSAVTDILMKKKGVDSMPDPDMLIVCGVWKVERSQNPYIILPWSPFSTMDALPVQDKEFSDSTEAWVGSRIAKSSQALHAKFRHLWSTAWRVRCVQFAIKGHCHRGLNCEWSHRIVNRETFHTAVKRLLRLNTIFCKLSPLYSKIKNEEFKKNFLGNRRYWLERLIREITFISAFEQDDATVKTTQCQIISERRFASVATALRGLLFYRLETEWGVRRVYSSLLEQIQLATMLGASKGFIRLLFHMLWKDADGRIIREHLKVMRNLENDVVYPNASILFKNIDELGMRLSQLPLRAFDSFHSLTTAFEYLTTHILFKICNDIILPRSWITLHVSSLCVAESHLKTLHSLDKKTYQQCLSRLVKVFCNGLKFLDTHLTQNSDFCVGHHTYKASLLHQRNAEILAVASLNLRLSGADKEVVIRTTEIVNEALALSTVRKENLIYTGSDYGACKQLARSTAAYGEKNPLMVFQRGPAQLDAVGRLSLHSKLGVVTMHQLLEQLHLNVQHKPSNQSESAVEPEAEDRFTTEQVNCIRTFQRLWRRHLEKVARRRSVLQSQTHQQVARFQQLTAVCHISHRVHMRLLLVTRGVQVSLSLNETRARFSALHKTVKSAMDNAVESTYEKVGEAVSRTDEIREALDTAAEYFSNGELKEVIDNGDLEEIEHYLEWTQACLEKINHEIINVEEICKEVTAQIRRPKATASRGPMCLNWYPVTQFLEFLLLMS